MSQWIILRTAPKRETSVTRELKRGLGLSTYVPVEKVTISNGRKTISKTFPLWRGYCFAGSMHAPPYSDITAMRDVLAWEVYAGTDVPYVLDQDEIDRIREIERELNQERSARPRGVCVGDRVNYKGPFATMNQLLKAIRKDKGLIVVPVLGTERETWVPLVDLEPAA